LLSDSPKQFFSSRAVSRPQLSISQPDRCSVPHFRAGVQNASPGIHFPAPRASCFTPAIFAQDCAPVRLCIVIPRAGVQLVTPEAARSFAVFRFPGRILLLALGLGSRQRIDQGQERYSLPCSLLWVSVRSCLLSWWCFVRARMLFDKIHVRL
jgi:hypothetical protein